jgi:phage/plasmid-like protein (TIGR03299 family)
MAHNLNKVNGKVSMAYTGETPWHGLGTKVEHAMTAAEVVEAAGLDYTVEKRPLFLKEGQEVPRHFATVRTDTNDVLGVVGSRYEIFQNRNGLSLLDAIVGVKDAIYHTAGALGKGEKVWLLAKLPGYVRTIGDDVTEKYILLSNSHDGSSPIEIMFTPIRVVCQNTLNVALKNFSKRASLRHTLNVGAKIDEVREVLGIVSQQYSIFEEASQKLLTVQLTKDAFKDYLKNSGVIPTKEEKDQSSRAQNILDEVSNLFQNGKGTEIPGVRGTLWGAFNAVTEYVDHHRGGSLEKRAASLLYGSGAIMKQRAWDNALALVK